MKTTVKAVLVVGASLLTSVLDCPGADPLDRWCPRNPNPPPGNVAGVAFGNGMFVACSGSGGQGGVLLSTNGRMWTLAGVNLGTDLSCVGYAKGRFYAGNNYGGVNCSEDGINWQWAGWVLEPGTQAAIRDVGCDNSSCIILADYYTSTSPTGLGAWSSTATGQYLRGLAYGNQLLVQVGLGVPMTSVNLNSVAFGDGLFVAVGDGGKIYTTTNNVDWVQRSSGTAQNLLKVAYGNGTFVAVGASGLIRSSTNGINWTAQSSGASQTLRSVSFGNGVFVAVGDGTTILSSTDASTWTKVPAGVTKRLCGVAAGSNVVVAVGFNGTVLNSADGAAWNLRTSGTSLGLYSVAYGNGTFAAVGQVILSSSNGVDWVTRDSGAGYGFETVAYLNNGFITVGAGGAMKTSPDGLAWTTRSSGTSANLYGIAYGKDLYVLVGAGGAIRTSRDGLAWTSQYSGTSQDLNGVTFGAGLFVAQGNAGVILTSPDGENWTSRSIGITDGLSTSAYAFGGFVMVGMNGVLLTSTNGVDWVRKWVGISSLLLGIGATADSFITVGDGGWIFQSDPFAPDGFLQQPTSQALLAGQTAQFTVQTWWPAPLNFEWRKDGTPLLNGGNISGAGSASVTLSNVLGGDAGGYSVVVGNAEGLSATSQVATLTVIDPVITAQPVSQQPNQGADTSLSVTVVGSPPITYQWRRNGTCLGNGGNISGADAPTLRLTALQGPESANYDVIVSNRYGCLTSAVAILTVNLATPDLAFNPQVDGGVIAAAVQADGKILLGGGFNTVNGQPRTNLARLHADATLDPGFNLGARAADLSYLSAFAVQADGKVVAGGYFTALGGLWRNNLARLNTNGTADTGFNPGADNEIRALAVQPDGKILVGGLFFTLGGRNLLCLGRLNTNNTVDTSFNFNPGMAVSRIDTIALQPDGKILVGGDLMWIQNQSPDCLVRINANGSRDASFNPRADGEVVSLALQPDGKILVGGWFGSLCGQPRNRLGRINANGTLDTTFAPDPNSAVYSVALLTDGKILVGGDFNSICGQTCGALVRLTPDGTLDPKFAPGFSGSVASLALQADGKLLVARAFWNETGQYLTTFTRLNSTAPASQALSYDGSALSWQRGGNCPEVWRTTFEYSTNGTSWFSLGAGTRIAGGWQREAKALPACIIRARGHLSGGLNNGSTWFVESTLPYVPPTPTVILFGDGSFGFRTNQFGFNVAGVPGQKVIIEASTDLQQWTAVSTNILSVSPTYFCDPACTNFQARYYRAVSF